MALLANDWLYGEGIEGEGHTDVDDLWIVRGPVIVERCTELVEVCDGVDAALWGVCSTGGVLPVAPDVGG